MCVLTLVVLWVLKRSTWNIVNPGRLLREELSFPKPFPSCCSLSLSSSAPARNCLSSYVSHILTVFKKNFKIHKVTTKKFDTWGHSYLKYFFSYIFSGVKLTPVPCCTDWNQVFNWIFCCSQARLTRRESLDLLEKTLRQSCNAQYSHGFLANSFYVKVIRVILWTKHFHKKF